MARQAAIDAGKNAAQVAELARQAILTATANLTSHLSSADLNPSPPAADDVPENSGPDVETTTLEPEGLMTPLEITQLVLDLVGIVDPSGVSDAASGLISLFKGDWLGAGLSAMSMLPVGDVLAKFPKLAKDLKGFEALEKRITKMSDFEFVVNLYHNLKAVGPALMFKGLGVMNKLLKDAEKYYAKFPEHYKAVQKLRLPTKGPIVFVPPKGFNPADPTIRNKGFVDAYGYQWVWDKTKVEWDVQLKGGKGSLHIFGKDAGHANISPTGKVTHK